MNRVMAIFKKDLAQVYRNRFIAIISVLLIVAYALLYSFMPSRVEEAFRLGLFLAASEVQSGGADLPSDTTASQGSGLKGGEEGGGRTGTALLPGTDSPAGTAEGQGLEIVRAESIEELREKVERGEVAAGVSLDLTGSEPRVVLYVLSKASGEVAGAGEALARELAYALAGYRLPADFRATVLGPDMAGRQVPLRDRLRVLFLALVFLLELYGVGNLLVEEIQRKTAEAVLVTPVTLREFVTAKAMTGMVMALSQGLLLALLVRALPGDTWPGVLAFLACGAAMSVGLAFIMGAVSRDFISMAMISLIPFVVLFIPGFSILYPGLGSSWIKALPTYYLMEPLNGMLNYGMRLSSYLPYLAYLLLFAAFFFLLGYLLLRRRLA